jgi:hypothetical protein
MSGLTENDLDHRVKWSPKAIQPLVIAGVGPPQARPERIELHDCGSFDQTPARREGHRVPRLRRRRNGQMAWTMRLVSAETVGEIDGSANAARNR